MPCRAASICDWEGIVAKRADSTYLPGKRSRSWIKIKNFRDWRW